MLCLSYSASTRAKVITVATVFMACCLMRLSGQARDSFEAVAVKHAATGMPQYPLEVKPGRLIAQAAPLRLLITESFGIEDYQLAGLAGWMESERYSIQASTGKAANRPQTMAMLREMLAARFHLVVHHETRTLPVFALVVDKKGLKMARLSEPAELAWTPRGDRVLRVIGSSIQDLVRHLNTRTGAAALERPVLDRTGLDGLFRIRLTFDVESDPDGKGGRLNIDYPSALVDELGLRLEPVKAPVDMLIVDSASKPVLDQ